MDNFQTISISPEVLRPRILFMILNWNNETRNKTLLAWILHFFFPLEHTDSKYRRFIFELGYDSLKAPRRANTHLPRSFILITGIDVCNQRCYYSRCFKGIPLAGMKTQGLCLWRTALCLPASRTVWNDATAWITYKYPVFSHHLLSFYYHFSLKRSTVKTTTEWIVDAQAVRFNNSYTSWLLEIQCLKYGPVLLWAKELMSDVQGFNNRKLVDVEASYVSARQRSADPVPIFESRRRNYMNCRRFLGEGRRARQVT